MERYVFLDFDGVLNTGRYHKELLARGETTKDAFGALFDPRAIDSLRMILEKSSAKIVITSSWRIEGVETLRSLWQHRLLPGIIADVTPFYLYGAYSKSQNDDPLMGFTHGCRGFEIAEWLAQHAEPETPYVILDDEEDILLKQATQFVKIDAELGITAEDARKAVNVLKSKPMLI